MAAIDKIYASSYEEYIQFKEWCEKQPKLKDKYGKEISITRYLFNYKEPFEGEHPVFNAPCYVDAYLIKNCPFDFVQNELMLSYGHKSQKIIEEMYDLVMKRGGKEGERYKDFYWWLTKDDFKIVDEVITYPQNENSPYMKIKRGELYATPYTSKQYIAGKHFKCVKHPSIAKFNRPFKQKNWFVDVITPDNMGYLWYHKNYNSWDFMDEFVIGGSSSAAFVKTIKTLKRLMIKWKLPVGTKVKATGRYIEETYEFIIKK